MPNMIPILVFSGTPQPRAVVFGWVESEPVHGQPVRLHRACMVLRCRQPDGFFGIASRGPAGETNLTPVVEVVEDSLVQQWCRVSPAAAAALDAWGAP